MECTGLNKRVRRKDVKEHVLRLKPSFVALTETKIKLRRISRFLSCIPNDWLHKTNCDYCEGGRICIAWDPLVWSLNFIFHVCTANNFSGTQCWWIRFDGHRSIWRKFSKPKNFSMV